MEIKINQKTAFWGALLPVTVLSLWTAVTVTGLVPAFLMPTPLDVLKALYRFIFAAPTYAAAYSGTFISHTAASVSRVMTGFALASLIGIPAGILSGRSPRFCSMIDPFIHLLRAVPGIAWLPLAMIWFGIGTVTTLFLIVLAAFFPVYLSTYHGAKNISSRWIQTAQMLGATRTQILVHVVLPGAFPSIEAGLRLALGIAWAYVVLGELTGVNFGLGAMIMDARMMGDVTIVIVGIICIALLGRISDLLLQVMLHRLPGHYTSQNREAKR
ncbi:MAG: ABC transporter permease [Syntrophaceae bacterium]|nr:ABC transporter permease [Syntrophaceae bacterium]